MDIRRAFFNACRISRVRKPSLEADFASTRCVEMIVNGSFLRSSQPKSPVVCDWEQLHVMAKHEYQSEGECLALYLYAKCQLSLIGVRTQNPVVRETGMYRSREPKGIFPDRLQLQWSPIRPISQKG
jgi:hypothetical protein